MGILSTIGKQIKGLNIVSNLKRAGALAAAIIVIPVEAAATAADARLSNIDRYNGLKNFCSKSAGAISKAAKATVEFTKLGVETMEATAQIVIGQPVVDRLQKVVEAIQKRADKLQGEEKEIIRDPQKFREDRVGRKKIWQQARAAKIMWDSKDSEVEGNSTSSLEPSTDSTETSKTSEAGSSMAQTLEEPSLANNNGTEGEAKVEETLKSTEKTTARGRLARVGQAIKDALTGVQGVASKAGQGVVKGAKSVASGQPTLVVKLRKIGNLELLSAIYLKKWKRLRQQNKIY